jgi:NitT/TauT family transport system substrate-binding protein
VIVARPAFIQAHPDLVRRLLTVHKQWTQKLADHPAAYAGQLADALHGLTHTAMPVDIINSSLKYVSFSTDPLPATFTAMAQWSHDLGIVKQPIHVEGLIDTSGIDQIH